MANEKLNTETNAGALTDFTFDDTEEWFGQKVETNSVENVIKEVRGGGKTGGVEATVIETGDKDPSEDDEDEDEVTFFGEEPTVKKKGAKKEDAGDDEDPLEEVDTVENKDDKSQSKKDDEEEDDDFYTTLASELKEKGIFGELELAEGEKITEEKFFELHDAEIEKRVDDTFQAFAENLDADAKAFLNFKKNGGNTADFLATFKNEVAFEALDLENPSDVQTALKLYLTDVEKLEGEDLTDRLNWLKEAGKEKTYAARYIKEAKAAGEEQRKALEKAQEKINEEREKTRKAFNDSLIETASKTEKVGDFTISKAEQKELGNYLTKPTVKVGKNRYVPAFQAEIGEIFKGETPEAKQKLILIAKLVKTNFDVKDLVTKKKTEVIQTTQSKLKEAKAGIKAKGSGGNNSRKALEDYF